MARNFLLTKIQEFLLTIGTSKRIKFLSQYVSIDPNDVILDVGGSTGKISEAYSRKCKEVVVLEPKHAFVEYGKAHRPYIRFIEGGAENIPMPDQYFDKVITSFSFHHFKNQDKSLEEMKRVLKSNGMLVIVESDPSTSKGKSLKFCETLLHTGAKFYNPRELEQKVEEHHLHVISVNLTPIGYFVTAEKNQENFK